MNDLHTLNDAFDEYERRADASSIHAVIAARPPRRATRPLLVAASVVAVAGIATGAVLIGHGTGSSPRGSGAGAPVSSAQPLTPPVATPSVERSAEVGTSASPTPSTNPPSPSTVTSKARAASYQDDFQGAFSRVIGDSAKYTITDSGATYFAGVLTTSDGVSGGYDIQYLDGDPGDVPTCPDLDRAHCTVREVAGGGSVAYIKDPLEGAADSYTNIVEYVRPDGVHFIMSSSNQRDPKGLSPKLADAPPLTVDHIIDILTSPKWR